MISIRFDLSSIDEFERNVRSDYKPTAKFSNLSECIRELAKVGNKVLQYQDMMKDPKRADEFKAKMNEMLQTQSMDEWSQTLSNDQLDGFLLFLQIQKDKRFEQKQFN